jgi:hypothetical protein
MSGTGKGIGEPPPEEVAVWTGKEAERRGMVGPCLERCRAFGCFPIRLLLFFLFLNSFLSFPKKLLVLFFSFWILKKQNSEQSTYKPKTCFGLINP